MSTEVLRAQEEWEAVDNIQPETGNCKNGTISLQQAASMTPSTCEANVSLTLGLGVF